MAKRPTKPAGELLREVRVTYGLSQGELATRANTTQSAISRIEAGRVSPSFDTLRELLRLLGADLVLDASPRSGAADVTPIDEGGHEPRLEPGPLLDALDRKGVDFVVIGGVAGAAHGSTHPTDDLDLAYAAGARNRERMAAALRGIGATVPGAPDDRPTRVDARTLAASGKLTFLTEFGALDILTEVDGVRRYDDLRAGASVLEVEGVPVRVASLDHLIGMKRRIDRAKDQLMLEEYVAIDRLGREWEAGRRGGD